MKENKNMKCDPCEQDFKKKVSELVNEGKAPSHMDRQKREHEVKDAFGGKPAERPMTGHKTSGHPMTGHSTPMPGHTTAQGKDAHAGMPKMHEQMAGMGKMKK